jgi:hypothetical protein
VLLAIGDTVGFNTVIRGDLPPERATWSFTDLSLPKVIRYLIGSYNRVMFYDATDPNKISELFVYGQSDGSPSEQPSSWPEAEPQAGGETRLQIKTLEANLGDPDAATRVRVVSMLGAIGSDRVVPILGQVLFGDPDPAARLAAVEALARQPGEAAMAFLEEATKDNDRGVRDTATQALERKRK